MTCYSLRGSHFGRLPNTLRACFLVCFVMLGAYITWNNREHIERLSVSFSQRSRPPQIKADNRGRYMIYRCDGRYMCGGWADRQKGIVATYLMSLLTDRKFRIMLTSPCDIRTYLQPRKYDWRIQGRELEGLPSVYVHAVDGTGNELRERLKERRLEDLFPGTIAYFLTNIEFVGHVIKNPKFVNKIGWLRNKTVGDVYRTVWKHLFAFNEATTQNFLDFKNGLSRTRRLVCAQIRLGKNPTMPFDVFVKSHIENVQHVWNFLNSYNDSKRFHIFVTADSESLREQAKGMYPQLIRDVEGPIMHVERSRGPNHCDGFKKAILDQMVLSTCDVLVISESGFGRIAALLRPTQKNLFCFIDAEVINCTETSPEFVRYVW